jgi:tetratricopeptide (TPR) repeat protein
MGDLDRDVDIVRDVQLPGLTLLDYPTRARIATNEARGVESPSVALPAVVRFREAISTGRLLPGDADGAFDQLPGLRDLFGDNHAGYLAEENRLRVALGNAGEQVLLRYLKGDEIAQSSVDFDGCAKVFSAAFQLTPEAFPLESDSLFCQGRSLIGQHRYPEAMPLLERAAKLTPGEAYVWNALGIGYLQVPDYERAANAFRDAIRRAPFWAYPRHNLALALREAGDLRAAIEQYVAAIQLAPQYSYLRYNLGLLYQQINDRANAAVRYREALDRAPGEAARARVMIAQATLQADRGQVAEALRLLDDAARLRLDREDLFTLRHDRALILSRDDRRRMEAESLWNMNLQDDPDYLPSMLALAEALERWGATDRAISVYRDIVKRRTHYVAARLKLAALLTASDPAAARLTIEQGIADDPRQPQLLESLGDNRRDAGLNPEAIAAYCMALGHSSAPGFSAEIARKLKALHSRPSDCPPN